MPHYIDGTEAKPADIVRGKDYNTFPPLTAEVVRQIVREELAVALARSTGGVETR